MAQQQQQDRTSCVVLYLRGIPWSKNEDEVAAWLLGKGVPVCDESFGVFFVYHANGLFSGDGFILIDNADPEMCKKTVDQALHLSLDKPAFGERYLDITKSSWTNLQKALHGFCRGEDDFIMRVRGLPFTSSEDDIRGYFNGFNVTEVILCANESNRPSGDAFVRFASKADTKQAFQQHRQMLGDRYVELFLASQGHIDLYKKNKFLATSHTHGGNDRCQSGSRSGGGMHPLHAQSNYRASMMNNYFNNSNASSFAGGGGGGVTPNHMNFSPAFVAAMPQFFPVFSPPAAQQPMGPPVPNSYFPYGAAAGMQGWPYGIAFQMEGVEWNENNDYAAQRGNASMARSTQFYQQQQQQQQQQQPHTPQSPASGAVPQNHQQAQMGKDVGTPEPLNLYAANNNYSVPSIMTGEMSLPGSPQIFRMPLQPLNLSPIYPIPLQSAGPFSPFFLLPPTPNAMMPIRNFSFYQNNTVGINMPSPTAMVVPPQPPTGAGDVCGGGDGGW